MNMKAQVGNDLNRGPWSKAALLTNGIKLDAIKGLYLSENHSVPEVTEKLSKETKAAYSYEEVFGDYCNINIYINCPIDVAFEYCANVYSLEEWTFSLRDLKHQGDGLYLGRENLAPDTVIYVRSEAYPDAKVVDYLCAWDQGQELWMRYYCRFVDAMPTLGKPGCVLMWLNCRHPNYIRGGKNLPEYIVKAQSRQDRPWVGDVWGLFAAGHYMEAENLKKILEQRFNK